MCAQTRGRACSSAWSCFVRAHASESCARACAHATVPAAAAAAWDLAAAAAAAAAAAECACVTTARHALDRVCVREADQPSTS
eukprot:3912626-Pleurochrysis_carterae.AAC.1